MIHHESFANVFEIHRRTKLPTWDWDGNEVSYSYSQLCQALHGMAQPFRRIFLTQFSLILIKSSHNKIQTWNAPQLFRQYLSNTIMTEIAQNSDSGPTFSNTLSKCRTPQSTNLQWIENNSHVFLQKNSHHILVGWVLRRLCVGVCRFAYKHSMPSCVTIVSSVMYFPNLFERLQRPISLRTWI